MNANDSSVLAQKQSRSVTVADKTDNPFAKFYGDPPYISRDMLPAEGRKQTIAPDLPEAYRGKNYYIPGLIEQMVVTTDNWYTQVACPVRFTDQITWTTNTTTFDVRLPRNTPHKAPSRILESRRSSKQGRLVRKGIAFEMESNFIETPEGQLHYSYTLNQMANAIITSLNIGVIQALLNADNYARRYEEEHGFRVSSDVVSNTRREIERWGIIQKEKYGLKKLDALTDEEMAAYQGKSDMWILPPKIKIFNDLVPPENTDFWLGGPRAPQNVDDSVVPQYTLNGKAVYLSRMFDGVLEFGPRNLLARRREIGSYFTMFETYKDASDEYFSRYKSSNLTRKAYNETKNDWDFLTLNVAHQNSHVYDQDGKFRVVKNNKQYSDISDRGNDMLTYEDNGTIKPVTLFGHLREEHFSVTSAINLAKTVANQIVKETDLTVGKMESILTAAVRLAQKIGEQDVNMKWMFNVFMEHVINSGVVEIPGGGGKDPDGAEWKTFVRQITSASGRSSVPMRVMKGQGGMGFGLPRMDYESGIAAAKDEIVTVDSMMDASKPGSGGSVPGSLAGFANWDGFLALQSELKSGPGSAPGYTKNGYTIADCQTASDCVDLIKTLTSSLQFLFSNKYYLDKNKASSSVENPSAEHVIFEKILGIDGFKVWFDASRIVALQNSDKGLGTPPLKTGSAANLKSAVLQFMKDEDVGNMRILASIKQDVSKKIKSPEGDALKAAILKKLSFYFDPVYGTKMEGTTEWLGLGQYDKTRATVAAQAYAGFFPLSNLSAHASDYVSKAVRSIVLDAILELITNNKKLSPKESISTLNSFLDFLGKITNLGVVVESTPDVAGMKKSFDDGVTITGADAAAQAKLVKDAVGVDFDAKRYAPIGQTALDKILSWFMEKLSGKKVPGLNEALGEYSNRLRKEYESEEVHYESEGQSRAPVLSMMGLTKDVVPNVATIPAAALSGASGYKGAPNAKGYSIATHAGFGDPDAFLQSLSSPGGFGESLDLEERFFRTPLVLSAKQVEQLKSISTTDRYLGSLMHVRVSDPSNVDKFVEPGRMKALVERIQRINRNGSSRFDEQDLINYRSEPPVMFYPENAKLRDVALASAPSKLDRMMAQSGKNKRRRTGGDGGRPRKFSRRTGTSASSSLLTMTGGSGSSGDDDNDIDSGNDHGSSDDSNHDDYDDYASVSVSSFAKNIGGRDDDYDDEGELTANVVKMIVKLGDSTNSLLYKIIGKVYYTSDANKKTLDKFIKHDILFPFGFLVFQPHKQYITYAGIKMLAGEETGVTLVAHSGLMLQNNAVDKTHVGHFTTYDDTVIKNEKNVYVAYDIFICGALGGAGFKPIDPRTYDPRTGENGNGDVIFIMCPYEETEYDPIMDVTGRFAAANNMNFIDQHRMNRPSYSQNWRACQTWRFRSNGQVAGGEESYLEDGQAPLTNNVVVRGQQFNYSVATNDFTAKVKNLGHMGEEGPGSLEGRNGGLRLFAERNSVIAV